MKRFIQGLGVGILLTTLVFTIAYAVVGEKEMTDAQIKVRAKQLGMVEEEESIFSTPIPQEDGTSDEAEHNTEIADTTDGAVENLTDASQQSVAESTENQTGQQPTEEEQTVEEGQSAEQPSQSPTDTISFTVQAGEGATKISENLQAAGLVDDAVAFDRYLRSQRYTTVILVGTYELRPGMSYEELAAVLLGR